MLPKLSDTKEIMGYGHWLIMRGQHAGNLCFDGHAATQEERDINRNMRELSNLIDRRLTACKTEDVSNLLDCYDLTYRIAFKAEPDSELFNRQRRRVLKAWMEGDRTIDESSVYGMLSPLMTRSCTPRDRKQLEDVRLAIRGKWIDTLTHSSYFTDATAYENYQRLALIMRENIDDCFNGDSGRAEDAKYKWYEYNRVDDLSTLGTQILRSDRRFVSSLSPSVLDFDEQISLDNRILAELSTRTDLDPYDRKAFSLALSYNQQLLCPPPSGSPRTRSHNRCQIIKH